MKDRRMEVNKLRLWAEGSEVCSVRTCIDTHANKETHTHAHANTYTHTSFTKLNKCIHK